MQNNAHASADGSATRKSRLLQRLGVAVRIKRGERGLTMRELAERARVSPRFLVQLEGGSGNISVARLADVAMALGTPLASLLSDDQPASETKKAASVALLGLRGAGKSSLGPKLAKRLKLPFVELDQLVAREAGMPLGALFEMHGEAYFRRLENEVLKKLVKDGAPVVIAAGGSIVTHPESYELLREHATTVWLKARAKDHWERVVAQGDGRPMKDRPRAMAELRALLQERTPLYSQADHIVDTSSVTLDQAVKTIVGKLEGEGR